VSTLAQGISGTRPRLTWSWEFPKHELCLHNLTISRHVAPDNTRVGRTRTLNVNPPTFAIRHYSPQGRNLVARQPLGDGLQSAVLTGKTRKPNTHRERKENVNFYRNPLSGSHESETSDAWLHSTQGVGRQGRETAHPRCVGADHNSSVSEPGSCVSASRLRSAPRLLQGSSWEFCLSARSPSSPESQS
jgi:hypothetical protein